MWDSESELVGGRDYNNGVLNPSKLSVKTDGFEQRGQAWSGKMNTVIYKTRDSDLEKIVLDDLPGGPEAFELAAKFCYGIAVNLTATNISNLRCAAEYLEMTEDLEEGNLIFKTEAFLSYVALSSWRDSILVLKSCEKLSPWAENLQIVRRCSESIAWKACANPKGIKWAYTGKPLKVSSPRWNESKDSTPGEHQPVPSDWWFEDVSILRIDHFIRVLTAIRVSDSQTLTQYLVRRFGEEFGMKMGKGNFARLTIYGGKKQVKGMRFELIGAAIMHYAAKWLPGLIKEGTVTTEDGSNNSNNNGSNSSWKGGLHLIVAGTKDGVANIQAKDQRMIIESLISIIPPQKDSVSCSFLLRLLRVANMLKVAHALVTDLEKRVGMQFEQASLLDLLIPSYNKSETLYDVDLVQRLLEHFLVQEQTENSSPNAESFSEIHMYEETQTGHNVLNAKMRVARLVDSYLTEVSRDRNLSLTKFQVLAESLPESARTCNDGLYRAIDSYLKAHPTLSEHERKRLCRVMDCQKLSIDACMHAAQNERLPLRVVVQVLFSEQVKISNAIANSSLKEAADAHYPPMASNKKTLLEGTPQSFQEGWAAAKKDINTLKLELESAKTKYLELQNDMESLKRQFNKMEKPKQTSAWTSGWKKLGKLTKMTGFETNDFGAQNPNAEQTRKTARRWRNSIS
ncbi:hypothetical protein TEA_011733 [Camellia sinensis var. sinensis]|uniref:NPH3 domain-containing protein n=1 Tax=Camellia sinensis var. sinensis TaxID=542762 RepID=A0A4S4DI99_CAMSN|nr:hypothetical protein TEA_011733 [Camellia sinensis var. sinensis]